MKKQIVNTFVLSAITMMAFSCQPTEKNAPALPENTEEDAPTIALVDTPQITTPPKELNLDPFYKKYMNVTASTLSVHGVFLTPVSMQLMSASRP